MEVAIGKIKIKHPIFMVKAENNNLVLSQLFLNSVKFNQEYKPNRIFYIIIYLYTYQMAIFYIFALQDPANRRENQIFPQFLN